MPTKKQQGKTAVQTNEEQCFVIMPISNQESYDDGHFQLVYEDIIKPAIIASGLKPCRADETKNTNLIQLDILRKVIHSPMAICDMSSKNPNVFYELGMRQAFDMPTVLLLDENTSVPFDVTGLRYVTYNSDMKHRNVVQAINELKIAIQNTNQKRNDRSEINSLIRLMDLAEPAKLSQSELSEEARYEQLTDLHLQQIASTLEVLIHEQKIMRNELLEQNKQQRLFSEPNKKDDINNVFNSAIRDLYKAGKPINMAAQDIHSAASLKKSRNL